MLDSNVALITNNLKLGLFSIFDLSKANIISLFKERS